MQRNYFMVPVAIILALACQSSSTAIKTKQVKDIVLPAGYEFMKGIDSNFGDWLLNRNLRNDKTVYLYNGKLKRDQSVQHAVLDIEIGKKDLVQCADAVMKLRAEFLFESGKHELISFQSNRGDKLSYQQWKKGTRWKVVNNKLVPYAGSPVLNEARSFELFMDFVYSYCGTYSLSKQLRGVNDPGLVQPGDVLVQGGFPGHAVIVMAVAKNRHGDKIFLLAQGYMPAQDIHILHNFEDANFDPWYKMNISGILETPEWRFRNSDLKRW